MVGSAGHSDPEREGSSGDSQEKLLSESSVPPADSPRDSGCYESSENLENGNDSLPRLWLSSPPLPPVCDLCMNPVRSAFIPLSLCCEEHTCLRWDFHPCFPQFLVMWLFHFSPFPFENGRFLRLLDLCWTKRVRKFGPESILFTVTAWNLITSMFICFGLDEPDMLVSLWRVDHVSICLLVLARRCCLCVCIFF